MRSLTGGRACCRCRLPTTYTVGGLGFLDAVEPMVDVQNDVLGQLDGGYSLALPAPNNPVPVLNTPFDVLLVVQTDSPEAAQSVVQDNADKLLEMFVAPLEDSEQIDDQSFRTLRAPDTGEPLLRVGAVDNLLVIGTGSAAQLALDARRGDNRLTAQDRWKNWAATTRLLLLCRCQRLLQHVPADDWWSAVRPVSQLGVQSSYLGDNLFDVRVLVALRVK
ncbi:MAG: hypothetical protein U0521_24545 [Anaerolineae bacterium]